MSLFCFMKGKIMRDLQTKDLFKFSRLLKAIGLKDEIQRMTMNAKTVGDLATEKAGFEFLFAMLEKATTEGSEKLIYDFFSDIFECEPEEIAESDPIDFVNKIKEVASPEKWKAFFSQVVQLMQSN